MLHRKSVPKSRLEYSSVTLRRILYIILIFTSLYFEIVLLYITTDLLGIETITLINRLQLFGRFCSFFKRESIKNSYNNSIKSQEEHSVYP